MKRFYFILVLTMGVQILYGQTGRLPFYYPDGKKYNGKAANMEQISKELEPQGRVLIVAPFTDDGDYLTTIGYKLFTNKPLWVLTQTPEKIKEAIEVFSIEEFFESYKFELELEKGIKARTLTDAFILETLGQPNKRTKYFDNSIEFQNWTYDIHNLELTLKKGIVTAYIRSN
ncbi:MAG: hypothetical protein ABI663_11420 [Chryseolinea sp.]